MQEEHLCEFGLQWLSRRHVIIFISNLGKIQSPPIKVQKVFAYATEQLCKNKSNKREKTKMVAIRHGVARFCIPLIIKWVNKGIRKVWEDKMRTKIMNTSSRRMWTRNVKSRLNMSNKARKIGKMNIRAKHKQ